MKKELKDLTVREIITGEVMVITKELYQNTTTEEVLEFLNKKEDNKIKVCNHTKDGKFSLIEDGDAVICTECFTSFKLMDKFDSNRVRNCLESAKCYYIGANENTLNIIQSLIDECKCKGSLLVSKQTLAENIFKVSLNIFNSYQKAPEIKLINPLTTTDNIENIPGINFEPKIERDKNKCRHFKNNKFSLIGKRNKVICPECGAKFELLETFEKDKIYDVLHSIKTFYIDLPESYLEQIASWLNNIENLNKLDIDKIKKIHELSISNFKKYEKILYI